MLPWKLRKHHILPVHQNLSLVYFSLAKFQLVSCNRSLAMIWQMTFTHKLPKLCSATLRECMGSSSPLPPRAVHVLRTRRDYKPRFARNKREGKWETFYCGIKNRYFADFIYACTRLPWWNKAKHSIYSDKFSSVYFPSTFWLTLGYRLWLIITGRRCHMTKRNHNKH